MSSNSMYPTKTEIDRRRSSARAKQPATVKRSMAAQLQKLALRLRKDPDELAAKIPDDTIRRLKYPVIETVDEQGFRYFKHDQQIVDGGRRHG